MSEHMPDESRLKDLLVGRKVIEARITDDGPGRWESGPTGFLTLDDGTVLKLWGNDGGCACSAGCYPLEELNTCDNVITNVEIEEMPDSDDGSCTFCGERWGCDCEGYYRIFVVAEARTLLASFEGSDGNGYYGTGWWLSVEHATVPAR